MQKKRLKKVEILSTTLCLIMEIYEVDKYLEKNLTKMHQMFSGKLGKLFYHIVIYWKILLKSGCPH